MFATQYHRSVSDQSMHQMQAFMASKQLAPSAEARVYRLVAVTMPGSGAEPERVLLALQRYQPLLDYLAERMGGSERPVRTSTELDEDANKLAQRHALSVEHVRRMLPRDVRQPNSLLRPFVLRAIRNERIEVHVMNHLQQPMQLALLDDDYGIQQSLEQSPLQPGEEGVYTWQCSETGIFPIFNEACPDGMQHRCLLGVLMIEP
jgi:hypothetical protein